MTSATLKELQELQQYLTTEELAELDSLISNEVWVPLPGPQTAALYTEADELFYGGAAGGGKGLALDTILPTPAGWVAMGDIKRGDELFDENGNICRVVVVSEINNRPCFDVLFDDRSSLISDDVHRWVTLNASERGKCVKRTPEYRSKRRATRPSRAKGNKSELFSTSISKRNSDRVKHNTTLPIPSGSIRNTLEINSSLLTTSGRRNHSIPVGGYLNTDDAVLEIPPYTLGAWLGDGSSRNGQLTSIDSQIWERIESDGFEVRHYSWRDSAHNIIGLKVLLRNAGVLCNKHIPTKYLRSSYSQRLDLLRGLMDTDGHAALDGGCEYDGVNKRLVENVLELVLSLGIKATITTGIAKLNGREICEKYRVKFTTNIPVFHLPRKLERLNNIARKTVTMRYIVSCEQIESVPTRCISVDSKSRQYLAGKSMVPTHNSDLLLGLSLTQHLKSIIFRRESTQLTGMFDRLFQDILRSRKGFNGKDNIWRGRGRQIEFGSCKNLGDEQKYQGRPHDLIGLDEITHFQEIQYKFLSGWLRTTIKGQRCRIVATGNPPTDSDGEWVISHWAAWLDTKHPNPALPGELRWYAMMDGKEVEVEDGTPFDHDGELIKPRSRTFIPSSVEDNPFLMETGYKATLQSLPEPLRSQMLKGDFLAGIGDNPWQVIPTAWVEAAMARWTPEGKKGDMDSVGVDPARGGKDNTCISTRYGTWFDKMSRFPGTETPDGPVVASLAVSKARDKAPIHVDVIGIGSSVYDHLNGMNIHVVDVNNAKGTKRMDRSKILKMRNIRAADYWEMREALDPDSGDNLALPDDSQLKADLCAPRWKLTAGGVLIEDKEQIKKRIGRSTDDGDATVMANRKTMKHDRKQKMPGGNRSGGAKSWQSL